MEQIFIQLTGILCIAFLVSSIARLFKQPIIIGYILSGIIIVFMIKFGIFQMNHSQEVIDIFSKFGIAFLLFIVGLHMNPKVIREVGVSSLLVGLGQIILTFILGALVSFFILGFNLVSSCFIGIAISFSSTIVVMKLLSDKRHIDSLYGKISVGILIIQDLFAIVVLMSISSISGGADFISFAVKSVIGGGALIILLFFAGYFIIPNLIKGIAKSQELLFLFSISFCFLISALFMLVGFSIEVGSLIAGVVLSLSPYSTEISARIRPLRDFFLIIFFIIIGLNINLASIPVVIVNALILSLVTLIFKPFILIFLMAGIGYTKRTNFLVGATLSQISEFSIIVLLLAYSTSFFWGVGSEAVNTIALTLVLTIFFSTYLIMYSGEVYKKISKFAILFEKKKIRSERKIKKSYDAVLFGYNRIGFSVLRSLKKIKKDYLVVDFNPDTINDLKKLHIPCLYGDIDDVELLGDLPLDKIQLAVSTVPDFEANILLINEIRRVNKDAIIIVRAHQIKEALELYHWGANYVLTPHFLGGAYIANMIHHLKTKKEGYVDEKEKHIKMLKGMAGKGHEHPEVEKN